jgi:hypothetical protein
MAQATAPLLDSTQARTRVLRPRPQAQGIRIAPQPPRFDKQKTLHVPRSFQALGLSARPVGYICRAAPDTRILAPGSEVISARSRDGMPMSCP